MSSIYLFFKQCSFFSDCRYQFIIYLSFLQIFDYIFLASVSLPFISTHLSKLFTFLFFGSFPMVEIFTIIWVFHMFIKFWLQFLLSAGELMFNNLWALFSCLLSSLWFVSDVNKILLFKNVICMMTLIFIHLFSTYFYYIYK